MERRNHQRVPKRGTRGVYCFFIGLRTAALSYTEPHLLSLETVEREVRRRSCRMMEMYKLATFWPRLAKNAQSFAVRRGLEMSTLSGSSASSIFVFTNDGLS